MKEIANPRSQRVPFFIGLAVVLGVGVGLFFATAIAGVESTAGKAAGGTTGGVAAVVVCLCAVAAARRRRSEQDDSA